ncbi:MAG: futalosine hydrolase [Phycisphaerales bacterium]|nr:futalosine hydrolase [Phycisphaerales bacterium]
MTAAPEKVPVPLLIVAAVREEVRALLPSEPPRPRREPPRPRGAVASDVSSRGRAEELRARPRVEDDATHALAADDAGRIGWPIIAVNPSITVAIGGVGRANAAGVTAQALSLRRYAAVLNIGVAGALPGGRVAIGDVILGEESVFAEEGIDLPEGPADMTALGFPLGDESWCRGNRIRGDAALLDLIAPSAGQGVERGAIATVARCSGTDAAAAHVARATGATAEAMEGAAVLLAAHRMGVHRCAEIRVISNTCGERLRQHWDLPAAFNRLDVLLSRLAELVHA